MKLANLDSRAVLVVGEDGAERAVDVATLSAGRFGPDVADLYARWEEFRSWADSGVLADAGGVTIDPTRLGPPSPTPGQVFAIGLNYADHATEAGFEVPTDLPPVFPKWQSALTGARGDIVLPPGGNVDWEVEVVAIIGAPAHRVPIEEAWDHVAGLTVGQDVSERVLQMSGPAPQFGLGKSYPGFAPTGPWLVTPDEFDDRDDLRLACTIDDEVVQDGRTSKLIFSIPRVIAKLSEVVTLQPGDLVFTGTPDGVGMGRSPQRFLRPGEVLRTWVDGIGALEHRFVAP